MVVHDFPGLSMIFRRGFPGLSMIFRRGFNGFPGLSMIFRRGFQLFDSAQDKDVQLAFRLIVTVYRDPLGRPLDYMRKYSGNREAS